MNTSSRGVNKRSHSGSGLLVPTQVAIPKVNIGYEDLPMDVDDEGIIDESGKDLTEPMSIAGPVDVPPPTTDNPLVDSKGAPMWNLVVVEVIDHARILLNETLDYDQVSTVIGEAFRVGDTIYNQQLAAKWGEDNFPDGVPMRVESELTEGDMLRHKGDIDALASERFERMSVNRLNSERVERLSSRNPEKERLRIMAKGVQVPLAEGFTPVSKPPPLTKTYQAVSKAVDGQFLKMVRDGLVLVLTLTTALTIAGIHFSDGHWAINHGKEPGRPIFNSSNRPSETEKLNGEDVKRKAEVLWGPIRLPTIVDIMKMILRCRDKFPRRPWSDLTVWKMDLKGAFTLLSFQPDKVKLFSIQVVVSWYYCFCVVFLVGLVCRQLSLWCLGQ